ncbi:aldose 1-epimerase [Achromobacter aloeverae]|nr:aldose 1-epimerase [Achromobacter aloeverae]
MTDTAAPLRLTTGPAMLELLPALGGTILRYDWHGVPVLRPTEGMPTAARVTACYPLVPYSNRIADGRLAFGGKSWPIARTADNHPLPIHGLAWQRPWTVTRQDATHVLMEQRYEVPEALAPEAAVPWPFPFHATQSFELGEDVLRMTLTLRNTGTTEQPAGLGWHPYFPRTPQTRVRAQVSHMWINDDQSLPRERIDTGGAVDDGLPVAQVDLDNVFDGFAGTASVAWPERGMAVDMEAHAPLGHLVIFTPPGKPHLAVEPVSNMTDAFNRYALATAAAHEQAHELADLAPGVRQDRATGTLLLAPGAQAAATLTLRPRRLR